MSEGFGPPSSGRPTIPTPAEAEAKRIREDEPQVVELLKILVAKMYEPARDDDTRYCELGLKEYSPTVIKTVKEELADKGWDCEFRHDGRSKHCVIKPL